jgi:hypothetical protein
MPSWTLQFTTFALKVRYHGDSVLRIIKLKICLYPTVSKICIKDLSRKMIFSSILKNYMERYLDYSLQ